MKAFQSGRYLLLVTSLLLLGHAQAKFMMPSMIPTERILKNTKAFLAENPESADAHYTVARIHYLTFANRMWLVQGWDSRNASSPPRVAPDFLIAFGGNMLDRARRAEAENRAAEKIDPQSDQDAYYKLVTQEHEKLKREDWKPESLSKEEIMEQANLAAKAFAKAIELDPDNALYLLGKASLEEQVSGFLSENSSLPPAKAPLDDLSPAALAQSYLSAYEASRAKDLERKFLPVSGLKSMVTFEAGNAIIALTEKHSDLASKVEELDTKQVKKDLEKLKKLKMGAITPIIIADTPSLPLAELVRKSPVSFDVDGDGKKEKLDSWPNEKASLLVWDPAESGEVTSGRQWFGTFGFNMLWRDGYQAMDALDDSRDGWLTGDELNGLALWQDANGNAVSDPGEVRSLKSSGITALSVKPESRKALRNLQGVRKSDGTTTASHDWIFQLLD